MPRVSLLPHRARRRLPETRNVPVRAERGDHDRDEDDDRCGQAVVAPALGVEQAAPVLGQEDKIGENRHGQATPPGEEVAEAHELRALVVVLRELGDEGRGRDVVEGDRRPDEDRHHGQIDHQSPVRPVRRRPEEVVADGDRDRGRVHERMASAPARAQVVRQIPDRRVGHGIEDQGEEEREGDLVRGQADDLAVEEQQQIGETVGLGALGDGAEAVGQLRREIRRGVGPAVHGRKLARSVSEA